MDEQEWLSCTSAEPMLRLLEAGAVGNGPPARRPWSVRKRILYASACWRRLAHLLPESAAAALDIAEHYADGLAGEEDLRAALLPLRAAAAAGGGARGARAAEALALLADSLLAGPLDVWVAVDAGIRAAEWAGSWAAAAEGKAQCDLLRDLAGNPFQSPPAVEPAWRSLNGGIAFRLAQAAYETRLLPAGTLDNDRLAVLADALEEAGCTDAALLGHLRSSGAHVRGCQVLDSLLGRT
jgi:hypothetical protein